MLLAVCCLSGVALNAQKDVDDFAKQEAQRSTPEYRHEVNKSLYGDKAAEEIDRLGEKRYWEIQFEKQRLGEKESDFSREVSPQLDVPDAAGWSIERTVYPSFPGDIGGHLKVSSSYEGFGYTVVERALLHDYDPNNRYDPTISVETDLFEAPGYQYLLLPRFFQINNTLCVMRGLRLILEFI